MFTPKIVLLRVVEHKHSKKFLAPADLDLAGKTAYWSPEGPMHYSISAGGLGSWKQWEGRVEEVDTPILLFRDGAFFDNGLLEYVGSQESGYHIVEGFEKIEGMREPTHGPRWQILARWFEVGDVLLVAYVPHSTDEKK